MPFILTSFHTYINVIHFAAQIMTAYLDLSEMVKRLSRDMELREELLRRASTRETTLESTVREREKTIRRMEERIIKEVEQVDEAGSMGTMGEEIRLIFHLENGWWIMYIYRYIAERDCTM